MKKFDSNFNNAYVVSSQCIYLEVIFDKYIQQGAA